MIKLFSVKEKQKQDAVAAAAGKPKQSAGELRVQKGGSSARREGACREDGRTRCARARAERAVQQARAPRARARHTRAPALRRGRQGAWGRARGPPHPIAAVRRRPRPVRPRFRPRRVSLTALSPPDTPAKIDADLAELTLPANIKIAFPDGTDKVMHFEVTILPDEGFYR